jgi:hypothetical protein
MNRDSKTTTLGVKVYIIQRNNLFETYFLIPEFQIQFIT